MLRERPVRLRLFAVFSLVCPGVFKENCFLWGLFVSVSDTYVGVNLEVCTFGSGCLPKRPRECRSANEFVCPQLSFLFEFVCLLVSLQACILPWVYYCVCACFF